MAAPRAETVPILANLLPASFQLGFTIIRVVPVWPTRLLRGTKDPRHRFVRRQWLLATIFLILSFLSCFYHLSHCSVLLSQFLHIYMSRSRKSAKKENLNTSERETKITSMIFITLRVILDVASKWELPQYRYSSGMRAITCECSQHII